MRKAATAAEAYAGALIWIERLDPTLDLRKLATGFGDPECVAAVDSMSEALFEASEQPMDHQHFLQQLGAARERYLASTRAQAASTLAPLNPVAH